MSNTVFNRRGMAAATFPAMLIRADASNPPVLGEGFSERPWYKAAVREGHTIMTPLFNSLLSGQPIFTAASPIYENGELEGVLGLDVNVDSWTKI